MSKKTRRELFGAVIGAVILGRFGVAADAPASVDESIQNAVYQMVKQAGWTEQPPISRPKGGGVMTGPLPVVGGCGIYLRFDRSVSSFEVAKFVTPEPYQVILSATGSDGHDYPERLRKMRNPTRAQIDSTLWNAGLRDCTPF